jgi:hypothetical protein
MIRVGREARLLFVWLWTIADDSGRLRAVSRVLASLLYPVDNDAPELIDGWLDELEKEGAITRYEIEGNPYIQIANWLKHQKIDHPTPSKIPEIREDSREPREDQRNIRRGRDRKGGDRSIGGSSTKNVEEPPLPSASPTAAVAVAANGATHPKATPVSKDKAKPKAAKQAVFLECPYQALLELYHRGCPDLPKVVHMTDSRRRAMQARWREWQQAKNDRYGTPPTIEKALEFWQRFFTFVSESDFLTGRATPREGRDPFFADLDFLFGAETHAKIVEGKYHKQIEGRA